jgi:hypothetical protein
MVGRRIASIVYRLESGDGINARIFHEASPPRRGEHLSNQPALVRSAAGVIRVVAKTRSRATGERPQWACER